MTNQEFECVLKNAAEQLPQAPETPMARAGRKRLNRRRLSVLAVAVLVIALMIPVVASTTAEKHGSGISMGMSKIRMDYTMKKLGVSCPDQLGEDYSLLKRDRMIVFPQEDEWVADWPFLAPFVSRYQHYYLTYRGQGQQELWLDFGKMDQDGWWSYIFDYDQETLEWLPDSECYEDEYAASWVENVTTVDYGGCTIYLYDYVSESYEEDHPAPLTRDAKATWIDGERNVCFQIYWTDLICSTTTNEEGETVYDYIRPEQGITQEEMLEYVKEIIDSNR